MLLTVYKTDKFVVHKSQNSMMPYKREILKPWRKIKKESILSPMPLGAFPFSLDAC